MSQSQIVTIQFENPETGATFDLKYRIFENPFCDRWLAALKTAVDASDKIENQGNFFGAVFVDEPRTRNAIIDCVRTINSYQKKWIELEPHADMKNAFLLQLHGEFERLEPHPDFRAATAPAHVRDALTRLNILIHQYQALFDPPDELHVDINFNPVRRFEFHDSEYELFSSAREHGTLYLAYGVTGVPVADAYFADHRTMAVPQNNFTAGMVLYFGQNKRSVKNEKMRAWLREHYDRDMDDPKLAIGYIPLGKVVDSLSPSEFSNRIKDHARVRAVQLDPSERIAKASFTLEPFSAAKKARPLSKLSSPANTLSTTRPSIRVTLENEARTSAIALNYELYDHDASTRWARILKKALQKPRTVIDGGKVYGFKSLSSETLKSRAQTIYQELQVSGFVPNVFLDLEFLMRENGVESLTRDQLTQVQGKLKSLDAKGSELPIETHRAVCDLIELLNQFQTARGSAEGHINVDFFDSPRELLSANDYRLFSLNQIWGELSLGYARRGLPPLNAFHARSTEEFHPPTEIAGNFVLSFHPDHRFNQWNELNTWLRSRTGKSYEETSELGAGSLPLAHLIGINDQLIREVTRPWVTEQVRLHPRVKEVQVIEMPARQKSQYVPVHKKESLTPAHWVSNREILYHLEHTPWIFLPVVFDAQACVQEAMALMHRSVVHRPYDQSGEAGNWRSLGIRSLRGDPTKTENHTSYGAQDPEYELTEIADLCPHTLELIERLTDIDQSHRIRFMFLEPGARIHVHSDAPDRNTSLALNIAFNMPVGCEFHIDANPDGTHNEYTRKIPIQAGSVFILNNAKYHYLFNHSDQIRVHMIIHGPLRFHDQDILSHARKQNQLIDSRALLNSLVKKYAQLGRAIESTSVLAKDWLVSGMSDALLPKEIRIAAVTSERVEPSLREECLDRITIASAYPMELQTIREEDINSWLLKQLHDGGRYAALMAAGTYLNDMPRFATEILRATHRLKNSDAVLMGHIISRKDNLSLLPFMHEQFVLLDLERWRETGHISLGKTDSGKACEITGFEESPENVHDDYTPLWLKPTNTRSPRTGTEGFCTRLIHRSLQLGRTVLNVPHDLRQTKKYAYPRSGRDWQYREIRAEIDRFLGRELKRVFVFNNERLTIPDYNGFKPETLISVAAGLKPLALLDQFWGQERPAKISLIDFSPAAIHHFEALAQARSFTDLTAVLDTELVKQNMISNEDQGLGRDRLRNIINDAFAGNTDKLLRSHARLQEAELVHGDFVLDPDLILSRLQKGTKTLFWHSNAWSTNVSYFVHSKAFMDEVYAKLIVRTKAHLGMRAWVRKWGAETLFGYELESPQVIFTDGMSHTFYPSIFREV